MLQSADPSEQLIADLQIRVERLEARGRVAPPVVGEILLDRLPPGATDVDRMLVAGYLAQRYGADNVFGTGDAHHLLMERGIEIGNPSQCIKQNLLAKRVFKHQGRYRVSQIGLDYLRELFGFRPPG